MRSFKCKAGSLRQSTHCNTQSHNFLFSVILSLWSEMQAHNAIWLQSGRIHKIRRSCPVMWSRVKIITDFLLGWLVCTKQSIDSLIYIKQRRDTVLMSSTGNTLLIFQMLLKVARECHSGLGICTQSDMWKQLVFVCLETLKGEYFNKLTFISSLTILLFPRTVKM